MSKQEKLAALIHRVDEYTRRCGSPNDLGLRIQEAYLDYSNTPDDPPQPPEMPECVRELCALAEDMQASCRQLSDAVAAVRDHYRRPLKLEVGKVYEDDAGEHVKVVWKNRNNHEFLGVNCKTDSVAHYDYRGVSSTVPRNLIREVSQ